MLTFRQATAADLHALLTIERQSFTADEAATEQAFTERIAHIADTFLVAVEHDTIVGFINGPVIQQRYITDDLFSSITANPAEGGFQTVLGIAVAPHMRNQHIGQQLMAQLEQQVIAKKREAITLTCKAALVPYYEKLGFVNEGLSSSTHGGEVWYNCVKTNAAIHLT